MKALQDEFLANGGEYKTYFLKDLFTIERGKRITKSNRIQGNRPLVTAGYEHYGIADYISNPEQDIFQGNTITIDMFANVFYRSEEYSADDNILVLTSKFKMNKQIGLFICSIIRKHLCSSFSYGKQYRQKDFNVTKIDLPTLANGELAFDFMASLIRSLEAERISELEAYLEVTGFADFKLTEPEINAISLIQGGGYAPKTPKIKWKDFKIDTLFTIQSSKKKFNANTLSFNGKYRYIARGSGNNGIRGYITEDTKYLNEAQTISFGQDTATMFYQEDPYFTGDKIKIMRPKKFILNEKIASFLITTMRLAFSTYSWGSSSFKESNLNETLISLPILEDGSIDYDYMECLTGAIQKQVIEKVVAYKDEVIAETKRIVHES